MTVDLTKCGGFVFRHLTTAVSILGIVWAAFVYVAEPRAQEYIRETLAPELQALGEQIEQQNRTLERLLRASSAETSQSEEEARINRRILCYQEALANGTNADECNSIP